MSTDYTDENACIARRDSYVKKHYSNRSWEDDDLRRNVADLINCVDIPVHSARTIDQLEALYAERDELLEALQSLFKHCSMIHSRWGDGNNQKEADAAIASAKAAIAKATGKTL